VDPVTGEPEENSDCKENGLGGTIVNGVCVPNAGQPCTTEDELQGETDGNGGCVPVNQPPEIYCNDQYAVNNGELGECGECIGGYSRKKGETNCTKDETVDPPVPGEPEEPVVSEDECLVINEGNYKGCGKIKCPEGSVEPYASSLAECYAAVVECEDPNRVKNEDKSCTDQCIGDMVLADQGDGTFLCEPPKQAPIKYCEDGETPRDPKTGCPEDYCPDGQLKDENGNCPSQVIECPKDSPNAGQTVDNLDDCYVTFIECPVNTPRAGETVNNISECGEPSEETCENGATDWPLCSECPDGTATDPETPCGGECNDCSCAEYAAENPLECLSDPCDDCSCAEYAAANPEECVGGPPPGGGDSCDDCSCEEYAAENPEECEEGEEGGGGGGGGGGGTGGLFDPFTATVSGDPELLARQEFPIANYLAGLFTGIK